MANLNPDYTNKQIHAIYIGSFLFALVVILLVRWLM